MTKRPAPPALPAPHLALVAQRPAWRGPTVALALGAGGARGFAHIPVIEALDELGITPVAIAGTSMGAIVGAAYAAGFTGKHLRRHALEAFRDQTAVASRLVQSRVGRFLDLLGGFANPVMVDGEKLLERFWPEGMPHDFEQLRIPFTAVATNVFGRDEVRLSSGALRNAVAGSLAIPGIVRPVERDGLVLIDGVAVNPVPVDAVGRRADVVIAVDLNGAPQTREGPRATSLPNAIEAMLSGFAIMEYRLMLERFARTPPTVHLEPNVGAFGVLDFMKVSAILRAADPIREIAKQKLLALAARAV
jgi:NTE family protein